MKKIILQGMAMIVLFFGIWFTLSQVDWMLIFKIQETTDSTEKKLGQLFWDVFKKTENENNNKEVKLAIDSIVNSICKTNGIEKTKIKIHVLAKNDINAFALPGGHLVIYTGLIKHSDNQEEIAGVISHELAHIQLNHVKKKLIQEVGISVLSSISKGGAGATIIKEAAKMLSSTAYERRLEKEADIKAVDYMVEAGINPEPFSDFLYKMSEKEKPETQKLTWLSTHPDSKERAKYILAYSKSKSKKNHSIISKETWDKVQEEIK